MAGVREQIFADQTQALKTQASEQLAILRIATAAIKNAEIDKGEILTDEETTAVIARQVKQLQDALKDFERGGRADLVAKTQKELAYLQVYLPAQLSAAEVEKAVKQILTANQLTTATDVPRAMGLIMKELKNKADGNLVKEIVNKLLSA